MDLRTDVIRICIREGDALNGFEVEGLRRYKWVWMSFRVVFSIKVLKDRF